MKLPSGLEIADPHKLLFAFVRSWYASYDGVALRQDSELSVVDIALSMMMSRTSEETLGAIFRRRRNIEEGLAKIPNIDLLDIPSADPIPGAEGIAQALTELCAIRRVTLAVGTKILHKKRPGLIPLLDRFVQSHYSPRWSPKAAKPTWGSYAVDLIKMAHQDMVSVGEELHDLQSELRENKTPLTPCRILNVLTWIVKSGNEDRIIKQADGQ